MKILGISGSLRQGSYNTRLLEAARLELDADVRLEVFDLSKIPLYNGDLDQDPKPQPVQELIAAISAADGLLFATPEYNYSVSGVLKNAIDWASRPAYQSVMRAKPSTILSASMSTVGGARAQAHLRHILASMLTPVFPAPEFLIASAHRAFGDSGDLADERSKALLRELLRGYIAWARHLNDLAT